MASFMFSHAGDAREMEVERDFTLGDVQELLCLAFGKKFPKMKAVLTIDDEMFDEFMQKPFVNHEEGMTFDVEFGPTDDPFFYDVADRVHPKISLEDEVAFDEAVNRGEVPGDTCIKSWVIKQRHQFAPLF